MRDVASLHAAAASGAPITAPALPRGSGAEPAYYLAPPGYARAARLPSSAGEAGGVPAHRFSDSKSATPGAVDDDEAPSVPAATLNAGGYWPPQSYGGPGSWRKKGDGNWEWIEAVGEIIEESECASDASCKGGSEKTLRAKGLPVLGLSCAGHAPQCRGPDREWSPRSDSSLIANMRSAGN